MTDVFQESDDVTQSTGLSNKSVVKGRNKKISQTESARREVVQKLMGFRQGRAFIYWLMADKCHFWLPSTCINPVAGAFDPLGTIFNEGARSVGIALHDILSVTSPDDYLKMIRESKEPIDG